MLDAISEFERGLRNTGAIAFFHYGGHGVQVDGKNYLLPADADIPDERRVATRAVALDEVMTAMDAAGARAIVPAIVRYEVGRYVLAHTGEVAREMALRAMAKLEQVAVDAAVARSCEAHLWI